MCSVTNINTVKIQRAMDEQRLAKVVAQIKDAENALVILLHHHKELTKRLGQDNPDGPEAA
jgi:hypothetical protein